MIRIDGQPVPDEERLTVPNGWLLDFVSLWTDICKYAGKCNSKCPHCSGAGCPLLRFVSDGQEAEPIIETSCPTPNCKRSQLTLSENIFPGAAKGAAICRKCGVV